MAIALAGPAAVAVGFQVVRRSAVPRRQRPVDPLADRRTGLSLPRQPNFAKLIRNVCPRFSFPLYLSRVSRKRSGRRLRRVNQGSSSGWMGVTRMVRTPANRPAMISANN